MTPSFVPSLPDYALAIAISSALARTSTSASPSSSSPSSSSPSSSSPSSSSPSSSSPSSSSPSLSFLLVLLKPAYLPACHAGFRRQVIS